VKTKLSPLERTLMRELRQLHTDVQAMPPISVNQTLLVPQAAVLSRLDALLLLETLEDEAPSASASPDSPVERPGSDRGSEAPPRGRAG
jgi:hypothetical protein